MKPPMGDILRCCDTKKGYSKSFNTSVEVPVITVSASSVVAVTSLKDLASRITPADSLLNSSVGISRSLDGDDAYVTDTMFIFITQKL